MAMGRLDAILGRSLLDAPDVGEDEAPAPMGDPRTWIQRPSIFEAYPAEPTAATIDGHRSSGAW